MGAAASILEEDSLPPSSPVRMNSKLRVKQTGDLSHCPWFTVSLGFWPGEHVALPDQFKLRISVESLDFVNLDDNAALVQFPYQSIICWGSSPQNFQFKVFDYQKSEEERKDSGILISLKTNQGKTIEDATMTSVQKLMADMTQAMSKAEFTVLLTNLFNEQGQLNEDWKPVINQFTSSGRKFLANQGRDLLLRIGEQAPFEKFDLACFIFERMINKDSVQLLINTFEDEQDRANLIHRLNLNKGGDKLVVTNCAMLPATLTPLPSPLPS